MPAPADEIGGRTWGMAKRYSGDLEVDVGYDKRNFYRASVRRGGEVLWRGRVNPAPAGFGPGVAYDSAEAYDDIARSALSFADDEKPREGILDGAEYDESLTRVEVRRSPVQRSRSAPPGGGGGFSSDDLRATISLGGRVIAARTSRGWTPTGAATGDVARVLSEAIVSSENDVSAGDLRHLLVSLLERGQGTGHSSARHAPGRREIEGDVRQIRRGD